MWRMAIESLPSALVTTIGRFTIAPVPRIADLWLVDDRGIEQCANRTDVGDREGATGQLVWTNFVGTGAVCHVSNARSHASQVQIASVRYNRNQQALVGIDLQMPGARHCGK